jgi:hypothetical protein
LELEKTVKFQFQSEISNPLKDWIDEYNDKCLSLNKGIILNKYDKSLNIILPSGNTITIVIEVLYDDDFYREVAVDPWLDPRSRDGRVFNRKKELKRPLFKKKKIIAWGYLKTNDGKGFNLILLEDDPGSQYGEWVTIVNTNNALSTVRRSPEPFPFDFDEIEKELQYIGSMHIYHSKDHKYELNDIIRFIEDYI